VGVVRLLLANNGVDLLDGGLDWDACVNGETTINCES
jgi:hypothetical protein